MSTPKQSDQSPGKLSNKFTINLTLMGERISLNIQREEEFFFRRAEVEINHFINAYKTKFPTISETKLLLFVALHFATLVEEYKADESGREALTTRIESLIDRLRRHSLESFERHHTTA
ncbi:MAG: cell division protein ZapA [Porphyromonas sp.]|nr:cell division protein ZapA [Porphyromonas sp.]